MILGSKRADTSNQYGQTQTYGRREARDYIDKKREESRKNYERYVQDLDVIDFESSILDPSNSVKELSEPTTARLRREQEQNPNLRNAFTENDRAALASPRNSGRANDFGYDMQHEIVPRTYEAPQDYFDAADNRSQYRTSATQAPSVSNSAAASRNELGHAGRDRFYRHMRQAELQDLMEPTTDTTTNMRNRAALADAQKGSMPDYSEYLDFTPQEFQPMTEQGYRNSKYWNGYENESLDLQTAYENHRADWEREQREGQVNNYLANYQKDLAEGNAEQYQLKADQMQTAANAPSAKWESWSWDTDQGFRDNLSSLRDNLQGNLQNLQDRIIGDLSDPELREARQYNGDALSDEERNIYRYIVGKYGLQAGTEYLDSIGDELNERAALAAGDAYREIAEENPALGATMSIATTPLAAVSGAGAVVNNLAGNEKINPYDPWLNVQRVQNSLQEGTQEGVWNNVTDDRGAFRGEGEEGGLIHVDKDSELARNISDFAVGTGLSTANSLLYNTLLPSQVIDVLYAAGAAGSRLLEAAEDPEISKDQATMSALTSGFFEALFEHVSIERTKAFEEAPATTIKNLMGNILKATLSEGSEEFSTDVANDIADLLINRGNSTIGKDYRERLEDGESEKEAIIHTAGDRLLSALVSFAGGAISGGVSAVGANTIGFSTNRADAVRALRGSDLRQVAENLRKDGDGYQSGDAKIEASQAAEMADDLASRERLGEKITGADYQALYNQMQQAAVDEQQAINQNNDAGKDTESEEEAREREIEQYYTGGKDIDADRAIRAMAKAKTPNELVEIRDYGRHTLNPMVKNLIDTAYSNYRGRMISSDKNLYQESDFKAAESFSVADAFRMGRNGGTLPQNATDAQKRAFLSGRSVELTAENKAKMPDTSKTEAKILSTGANAVITGIDHVDITRTSDGPVRDIFAKTSDGKTVNLKDIQAMDPAMRHTFRNIQRLASADAMNAYIDNAPKNMPVGQYANAFYKYYGQGSTGTTSFDDLYNNDKTAAKQWFTGADKAKLQAIYDLGQSERNDELMKQAAEQDKTVVRRGTGKVTAAEGVSKGVKDLAQAMADRTGLDINLGSDFESQINGQFIRGLQQASLNVAKEDKLLNSFFHETVGEFMQAFNAKGMNEVQDAVLEYVLESEGIENFTEIGKRYQSAYSDVEGTKTFSDAMNEMVNDSIAGLFSSEEGVEDFTKWLGQTNPNKQKTILQKAADFFKQIADTIRNLINRSHFTGASLDTAQMAEDRAREIRQKILQGMDAAIQNAANAQIGSGDAASARNAINIVEMSNDDFNNNIHKAHLMDPVAEVPFASFALTGETSKNADIIINQMSSAGLLDIPSASLGDVEVSKRSIKTMLSHRERELKASLINAIPEVLKHGQIVAADHNHKGRSYNTVTLVAPVTYTGEAIDGTQGGTYYTAVVAERDYSTKGDKQRLHVIDALIEKKGLSDNGLANRRVSYGENPSLKEILRHVNGDVNLYDNEGIKRKYSVDIGGNDEYSGGVRHSIDTMAESLNLAFEKDGSRTVLRDQDGHEIKKMSVGMVKNTPLGGLIGSGVKKGFITAEEADAEYQFVSDLINQMLKTQDLDLIFAVNSVVGFQQLQSGERPAWTKNPRKSKNAGYVSNSDPQYSSTVDFTTICVKSQAIIDAMSATMKKLGRGLTPDEITNVVYKNTHDAGEPVPCPVCYVFSRWVGLGGLFDNMKNLQDKYANADVKTIRADMADLDRQISDIQAKLDGKKKARGKAKENLYKQLKEEFDKLDKLVNAEKLGGKVLLTKAQRDRYELIDKQIGLLNDWTWLEKVRLSKNYKPVPADVLFDINAGTRFANEYPESWTYRTTRGPAMGKAATPYADEHIGQIVRGISSPSSMKNLGDLTKDPFVLSKGENGFEAVLGGKLSPAASRLLTNAVKKARVQNLLNGQRMQSTSDFRFEYALDYLMALIELQSVGAKVQMYTKVPESVGFLASAGAEINLSLMPFENGYEMDEDGNPVYDEDGNLKLLFSDVTGMHPDDAFRLSSMYDNVQPIVVGTNDIHMKGLMADPRVTFIIPYHASGSNEQRYIDMMRAVGERVSSRTDYSNYQTDTERSDATPMQKAAFKLREDIVTGKARKLTVEQKAILSENENLHQLYQRFYGKDMNGKQARIENKYLDAADRGANGYGTIDHNTFETFLTSSQAKTIMPYEYWDKLLTIDDADQNGRAFIDYCNSMGLSARFTGYSSKGSYNAEKDFGNVPGYWKMLPDRAMYNRDGTYHEQKAINVSDMRMDYLDRAKTIEGITKPSVENDRNKVEVIAQKSVEEILRNEEIARVMNEGDDIRHSVEVTDRDTLDFLENQEHITTYRTFQQIGDGLYAPMNAMENGKLGYKSRIGVWEQATEDPSKVKDGKFPLRAGGYTKSGKNRTTWAAYNPYLHSSNLVFNDQFSGAYDRPNLVVVECEVPASELTSGYHADQAKDPVGWLEWKSGKVANALKKKGIERKVMLSRWMKPVRILSNAEVAQIYKESLEGTGIVVPWNVVSPPLREELEKRNVDIDYGYQSSVKAAFADKFGEDGQARYSVELDDFWFGDNDNLDQMESDYYSEQDDVYRPAASIMEEGAKALADEQVDITAIRRIATEIKREYGSSYDTNSLIDNLEKVFAFAQSHDAINYDNLMSVLAEVAQPVIDESTQKVGAEEYQSFMDALKRYKIALTDKQKAEVQNAFGSYQGYRRAMRGIDISNNGITLDRVWGELNEVIPGLLDEDATEGDMPLALYDAMVSLEPTIKNTYGADSHEVARDLALEIVEKYFEQAGAKAGNEKAREAAKRASERAREAGKKYKEQLRKRYNERLAKAREDLGKKYSQMNREQRERFQEQTRKLRETHKQDIAEIRARNRQQAINRRAVQDTNYEKQMIDRRARKMATWLRSPSDSKHVPKALQRTVESLVGAIDFVTPHVVRTPDGWTVQVIERYDPEGFSVTRPATFGTRAEAMQAYRDAYRQSKQDPNYRRWTERMSDLRDMYNRATRGDQEDANGTIGDFLHMLDTSLTESFSDLIKRGTQIEEVSDLGADDLRTLNRVLANVEHAVNQINKAYSSNAEISALAQDTIQNAKKYKGRGNHSKVVNSTIDFLTVHNATPETFFHGLGKGGEQIYKMLRKGLNQRARDIRTANEYTLGDNGVLKGIDISKWSGRKVKPTAYKLQSGETVYMTPAQVMSLYELSKRQQAMFHQTGGFSVEKQLINGKEVAQRYKHFTDADVKNITDTLSDEQKRVADDLQKFLARDCAEWGNETSNKLYGYDKFGDPNYFPISTDKEVVATQNKDVATNSINAIKNMGFTKEVKPNAQNPIVIRDIFDVFTGHVTDMAAYHAYAAPITDLLRWYNYTEKDVNKKTGFADYTTTKGAITDLTGSRGGNYVTTLLSGLNNMERSNYFGGPTELLMGHFKAAAIAGNARVVIQQPTAYFRAGNVISYKWLTEAIAASKKVKDAAKRMQEETSDISWWKSQGYWETGIGKSLKNIITGDQTAAEKFTETTMAPAGKADDITWGVLYRAVYMEQADQFRKDGKAIDTDEFTNAVNDRFDEVIDRTQVVDSTLHRSQFMRATDPLSKTQTAFMAEPTKNLNMFLRAHADAIKSYQDNGGRISKDTYKNLVRAGAAVTITAIVNAAAQSVIDAMRHHSDDKDYLEQWLEEWRANFLNNMNPLDWIPILKDLGGFGDIIKAAITGENYNMFSGSDSSRMDMAVLNQAAQAFYRTAQYSRGKGSYTLYGVMKQNVRALSQLAGMPFYNLMRDAEALYNTLNDRTSLPDLISKTSGSKNAKLFQAIDSGKGIENTVADEVNDGRTIKEIQSAITSHYKSDYYDYFEAEDDRYEDIGEQAAAAFKATGMSDEEIANLLEEWRNPSLGYSMLDGAIDGSGDDIDQMISDLRDADKSVESIKGHLVNRYASTLRYNEGRGLTDEELNANLTQAFTALGVSDPEDMVRRIASGEINEDTSFKYTDDFVRAINTGGDIEGEAQKLRDAGKENDTIKSAITSIYKDQYAELLSSDPGAAADLKERLVEAFMAAGDTEEKASKKIDNWITGPQLDAAREYFTQAIETGGNLSAGVNALRDLGQDDGTIRNYITSEYKQTYTDLYGQNQTEAAKLKKKLVNAFMAAGDSREDAEAKIDNWITGPKVAEAKSNMLTAINDGGNITGQVEELRKLGKDDSTIKSYITSEYKPQYIELYNTNRSAALELQNKLIRAYMAAGDTHDQALKKINKWVE